MTDAHTISTERLLLALPDVLKEDEVTYGLASAIASALNEAVRKVSSVNLYANIDSMDEAMLDILAEDFKIDWWEPNAGVESKRDTLKTSWYVHRHLGTKSAIKKAVARFIGSGTVQEWFEYGGMPHHYRIKDGNNAAILSNYQTFLALLRTVQRGSSVLDHITALMEHRQTLFIGTGMKISKTELIPCQPEDVTIETQLLDSDGTALLDADGAALLI